MPDTFNCPNCGAPLDYKGTDPIIRCPFCSSSVIVPDNLRGQPAFSSQPHNFTITGSGNMVALLSQAKRFKDVKDLALAGNKDEAVRIFMEITGVSNDVARNSVESMVRGMPIKLSNFNVNMMAGGVTPPVQFGSGGGFPPISNGAFPAVPNGGFPSNNYDPIPVNENSSGGLMRTIGCGIGCLTAGFVILILILTLVPAAAGIFGAAVSLNPNLVLTMMPAISDVNATPVGPVLSVLPEPTGTPEAVKSPTAAPTATAAFANQALVFGKEGTTPGLFKEVRAITIDPVKGTIIAADYSDGRVQAFDSKGKFLSQWTLPGKNPLILGMAVDQKSNIFIASAGNILVYNPQGKLTATIKPASLNDHYEDVAVMADGSLMVVSRGENVVHLSNAGKIINRFDAVISHVTGNSELNSKIAVDTSGNFYLLGTFNNAVFIYTAEGKFIRHFGSEGDQPGEFRAPLSLAVDAKGNIYVSDFKGVQIFSNDGSYNNVLEVQGAVFGLAFDPQGSLYLTTNIQTVEKYDILQ